MPTCDVQSLVDQIPACCLLDRIIFHQPSPRGDRPEQGRSRPCGHRCCAFWASALQYRCLSSHSRCLGRRRRDHPRRRRPRDATMPRAKPMVLVPAVRSQVGTPLLSEWPYRFRWLSSDAGGCHMSDLFARLLSGGSSSTAVTDGQNFEGGASTTITATPGAAAIPCLLPISVGARGEGTMLACLLAVWCVDLFSSFSTPIAGSQHVPHRIPWVLSP